MDRAECVMIACLLGIIALLVLGLYALLAGVSRRFLPSTAEHDRALRAQSGGTMT